MILRLFPNIWSRDLCSLRGNLSQLGFAASTTSRKIGTRGNLFKSI
jgi:hypothetical protein